MSKTPLKIDTITEELAAARRQTAGCRPLNDVKCSGGDGTTACAFFFSSFFFAPARGWRERKKKRRNPKRVTILGNLSFRICFLHLPLPDPQPRRLGPLLPIRPTAHLAAGSSLTARRGAGTQHRRAPAPLLLLQLAVEGVQHATNSFQMCPPTSLQVDT